MIHKIRRYSLFSILLSILLVVPGVIQAQDGHDLSDEEYALVERFVEANSIPETYHSAEVDYQETSNTQNSVVFPGNEVTSHDITAFDFIGFILLSSDKSYDASGEIRVNVDKRNFAGETTEYGFNSDIVMVDQTLYLQSDYLTNEGSWMVIAGADNIPENLAGSDIDNLFDFLSYNDPDEVFDLILADPALLASYVSSIGLEEITLSDESTGEVISLWIADTKFDNYLQAISADDPDVDFITKLTPEQMSGEIIFTNVLNPETQVVNLYAQYDINLTDIDLDALNPDQPEDSWLSIKILITQNITYTNIDAEFDPIEAPE